MKCECGHPKSTHNPVCMGQRSTIDDWECTCDWFQPEVPVKICDSCSDEFHDEGIDPTPSLGDMLADHLCDRIESGSEIECICTGHTV